MDSEEGQEVSQQLYKRIDQLGLSKGSALLGSVIKTDRTMSFPEIKEALREPTRPPVEPAPEVNGTKRPTILDIPAFQEAPELGVKGTNIHPPQLVENFDDENLRRKRGELVQPKPQYSIQTLAEQIKQGVHPEIGGHKVGFVPFKPPPKEVEKVPGTEILPLPRTPVPDLYLPVVEGLAGTQMMAWKVPGVSEEPSGPDPKTLQLASSLVAMDILEDMPKLEELPPPPFQHMP